MGEMVLSQSDQDQIDMGMLILAYEKVRKAFMVQASEKFVA